jgi:uncharacterized protein YwgA
MTNGLTSEEWVLAILYANDRKPIYGKLMLVKQVFLTTKEVEPDLDKALGFFAYDLGPYSASLAQIVDSLVEKRLVSAEGSGGDFVFSLTTDGRKAAEEAWSKLPLGTKELLARKRRAWDQLGYRGIVRLVYTKYPQYTGRSKIIELLE